MCKFWCSESECVPNHCDHTLPMLFNSRFLNFKIQRYDNSTTKSNIPVIHLVPPKIRLKPWLPYFSTFVVSKTLHLPDHARYFTFHVHSPPQLLLLISLPDALKRRSRIPSTMVPLSRISYTPLSPHNKTLQSAQPSWVPPAVEKNSPDSPPGSKPRSRITPTSRK